ncbi:phosphatidate cytidylyltransferase [Pseudothauera rhizosphaerae]|uniref:Phosphatidate cytidylyltransferase n=1 Tax=Pseudothauera rhizosphaerae TaxID=2565932 RepID=A0A4V3WBJ1_9RHOO|nr:phosphatidate cytidylyltransferase [Pseudothauera rhizosphaerae]THF63463.1 phosphatidate cytidylyltransferase [Pseudothauera rhizosphaerae]
MLKTRVITAVLLLGALLGAVFYLPPLAWLALSALICGAGGWEWGGLTRLAGTPRIVFAVLLGLLCLVVGWVVGLGEAGGRAPFALGGLYLLGAVFWLVAVPLWLRRKWQVQGMGAAVAVGAIVLLPPALVLAQLRQLGPWLLLAALAICWVADIAAYFAGRAFGRRKLAPAISPGKTWEGAWGALAGVLAYGFVAVWQLFAPAWSVGGVVALALALAALTAVSIVGDLFESLLKRQAGMKDSGTLLPGHGGILDRIDSLTSTLPLVGLAALCYAR